MFIVTLTLQAYTVHAFKVQNYLEVHWNDRHHCLLPFKWCASQINIEDGQPGGHSGAVWMATFYRKLLIVIFFRILTFELRVSVYSMWTTTFQRYILTPKLCLHCRLHVLDVYRGYYMTTSGYKFSPPVLKISLMSVCYSQAFLSACPNINFIHLLPIYAFCSPSMG